MHPFWIIVFLFAFIGGCGSSEPNKLRYFKSGGAPEEFDVAIYQRLEVLDGIGDKALPKPGSQANRADINPATEAITILGGDVNAGKATTASRALFDYTSRFGASGNIRQILAAEDKEFRQKNQGRLLHRLFKVTTYYSVYADQALDPVVENNRLKTRGIKTPRIPKEFLENYQQTRR